MQERASKLGLWICLPLLAWVAVWIAAASMPASDCDGYGTDAGAQEAVLIAVVAVASLGAAGAALFRLVKLGRAKAFSPSRDLTVGGIVLAVLAVAAVATASRDDGAVVVVLAVFGLVLTGLTLIALLIAWAAGLRADRVGLLLPLYLLGAAVFAYPVVGLLGLLSSSGIGC